MNNLLRSEFYKLRCSKALKVIMIIAVCTYIISAFITNLMSNGLLLDNAEMPLFSFPLIGGNAPYMVMGDFDSITLFMGIFASVFIAGEFSKGTIKNILAVGKSRFEVYCAKLLTLVFVGIFLVLSSTVTYTIFFTFLFGFGKDITAEYIISLFKLFCLESLFFSAYAGVFTLIAISVRNIAGAVGASIGAILIPNIMQQLTLLMDLPEWVPQIFLIPYMEALSTLEVNVSYGDILVALGIILCTTGIGMMNFSKADIK